MIATGDAFMNDPAKAEFVKNHSPNLQAVEMEGAAVGKSATNLEPIRDHPFIVGYGKESNVFLNNFRVRRSTLPC